MYIVLLDHKNREALSDCIAEMSKTFTDPFTIEGSEEKGYQLRLNGAGDEKEPRAFAKKYLKTWKPKPPDPSTET